MNRAGNERGTRISVITPAFNAASYIGECIENVLKQHCSVAEHVIADGGSSDQTVEIIRRYAAQHPSIRWISEPDRGQSDAMNKATALARGEIIGVLNVDDFYETGVLNRVIQLFENLPQRSLLVANCNVWNEHGELLGVDKPSILNVFDLVIGSVGHPLNPSAYFYHKVLHDLVGGYDVDEHQALDLDFLLKALRMAKASYVNELWGNWRLVPGTKTFQNRAAGNINAKIDAVRAIHRQRLALPSRIAARFCTVICRRSWGRRFYYYLRHPLLVARSVHAKLSHPTALVGAK